jgi:hypothetical protein
MAVRPVLLVGGVRTRRPDMRDALLDDLRRLQERRGQMIAAVDEETGAVVGTLGLFPDRDEGGRFFHLAGLQLEPGPAPEDVDVLLLEAAGRYLGTKKVTRLKFGTSPLLTRSAWLYVNQFGARYRWREGTRTPEGRPWPYVSCECDFDDPLARPLDLREEDVLSRCLLIWERGAPVHRVDLPFSGPLCVALPDMDADGIGTLAERDPDLIAMVHSVFQSLHVHGYEFAWFDRLTGASEAPGAPRWYYLMKHIVSL